ncbi:Hypothetical predicted protein [Mytilus galloprovincialis]|uniref:Integrin alpha-2 domain-containing protein n=1 Tax=Mytilus galloprovincialis TaxID=29158 RepID=A0A8B6HGF8_MYTGA|nr:Hypothetical predicted protein [Mytilus galloprovincialis]
MRLTSYLFRFKMDKVFFSKCSCGKHSFLDVSVIVLFVCIFGYAIPITSAFNLDLKNAIIQRGETGSMFGFSVAQHLDQNTGWMLVGAPEAQTNLQPGIVRGGAVYRCSVDTQLCRVIPFDRQGNDQQYNGTTYLDKEDKSYQWFGATVVSSGVNGLALACAPRYKYHSTALDKVEPVGTCYLGRPGSTSFTEYAPCRNSVDTRNDIDQHHKHGKCTAGFSASITSNGNRLLIGAPGAFYWQGQVYNVYLDKGNQAVSTKEGGMLYDDSYRGYSSAVGNFNEDADQEYIVGVPRAELLRGQITIYRQDLGIIRNITGEQVGAYFGYALAVQDLDGNNLDDIIVGAPLYSNYTSVHSYDTGRVYVYYQNRQREFNPKKRYDILEGQDAKSRFGAALTGLGDINYDGYKDLAVGAPYGGKEGKGAIYIYHGSMKGILTQVSQVIHGADFPSVKSFGFSLSGGLDLDKNQYPDLLVGAYESQAALQLWARPIVRVAASVQLQPQTIDLEQQKTCPVTWSQAKVLCFNVGTCVKYNGLGVSERLMFDLSWEFDSLKKTNKRVFLLASQLSEEMLLDKELERNKTFCYNSFVYIKNANSIRDKLTPIQVNFNFKLAKDDINDVLGGRKKRQALDFNLEPVLDQYTPTLVKAEANILKNCGPDEVCIPDLSVLPYSLTNRVIMGNANSIDIIVNIANRGEDAYETYLYIDLPKGVEYGGIRNQENAPICEWLGRNNASYNLVNCSIGNPFQANRKTNFTMRVYPTKVDGLSKDLVFSFRINSTNPENKLNLTDNQYDINILLQQSSNLTMIGETAGNKEQVVYSDDSVEKFKDTGFGPTVVHEYKLTNLGYSDIKASLVHIYWPSFDDLGNNLLYLTTVPTVSGTEGVCTEEIYTPANSTLLIKGREDENSGAYRTKRATRSDNTRRITCTRQWCTRIVCNLRYMEDTQTALIKVTARIWTDTLVKRGLSKEPFHLVSQAVAQVKEMPYDLPTTSETFRVVKQEVVTYVNAGRLAPPPKSVEPWIIGVAIAGGLLLLLLLILLLWWCGFFRRKRPEDAISASQKPLVYKNGSQANYGNQQMYGNPSGYGNDLMSRPYE